MFVVTLPKSAASKPQSFALRAKKAGADILEIRGDITPEVKAFVSPLPLLVAPRGRGIAFIVRFEPAYVDLEISEQHFISKVPKNSKVILSLHDYEKTPNLSSEKKIVQKLYSFKPWMIKIAAMVTDENDLLSLWNLQNFLNKKSIRSTVLGMGQKAHLIRVTSPFRNAFTYTFLDGTDPSAPGQLPLSFYRITRGRKHPKFFGIIGGNQITSSLSPLIHNALFQKHRIDALYSCFPTQNFKSTIRVLRKIGVQGFSVTAPFKREAFRIAKMHDAVVDQLGAANTLTPTPTPTPNPSPEGGGERCYSVEQSFLPPSGEGSRMGVREWHAFNTDVFGIEKGYPELKKARSIAILGAGGAVPSAILAIRRLNPNASITVFARDTIKAKAILKKFQVAIEPIGSASSFKIDAVICAVSEDVHVKLPQPISKTSIAIDLRYGKMTSFMIDAKKEGYRMRDGIPMLMYQALRQFEHFTGKNVSADDVASLHSALQSHAS